MCENPAVLRAAAARLGPRSAPLVCSEGVPSTACWRLLGAAAGTDVLWRNDFDWAGLRITGAAVHRVAARPWRMGEADYAAALATGDSEPLRGAAGPEPLGPRPGRSARRGRAFGDGGAAGRRPTRGSGDPLTGRGASF